MLNDLVFMVLLFLLVMLMVLMIDMELELWNRGIEQGLDFYRGVFIDSRSIHYMDILVSKESAYLVILNDNFSTIVTFFNWGHSMFGNINFH